MRRVSVAAVLFGLAVHWRIYPAPGRKTQCACERVYLVNVYYAARTLLGAKGIATRSKDATRGS